jgi:hypothetical protein
MWPIFPGDLRITTNRVVRASIDHMGMMVGRPTRVEHDPCIVIAKHGRYLLYIVSPEVIGWVNK